MLEQPLLFTSCSSIQFFNSPRFPKDNQLRHTSYPTSQCAALVSLLECHTRPLVTKRFPPNPSQCSRGLPQRWKVSLGYASAHILSLLPTSLISNCGLLLICIKIKLFLLAVKRLAYQQLKAAKIITHPNQQPTSVLRKIFSKISPSKLLKKLLPQKIHFKVFF